MIIRLLFMKSCFLRNLLLCMCFVAIWSIPSTIVAQKQFKGDYINEELKIKLKLNLSEPNIPVPGFELDSCYGFLQGGINGSWIILKVVSMNDSQSEVRAVSERGSDAQNLILTLSDSSIVVRQKDDANIKGVKGRKYVKLPKDIEFVK